MFRLVPTRQLQSKVQHAFPKRKVSPVSVMPNVVPLMHATRSLSTMTSRQSFHASSSHLRSLRLVNTYPRNFALTRRQPPQPKESYAEAPPQQQNPNNQSSGQYYAEQQPPGQQQYMQQPHPQYGYGPNQHQGHNMYPNGAQVQQYEYQQATTYVSHGQPGAPMGSNGQYHPSQYMQQGQYMTQSGQNQQLVAPTLRDKLTGWYQPQPYAAGSEAPNAFFQRHPILWRIAYSSLVFFGIMCGVTFVGMVFR